jgi:hypothetical protein
MKAIPLSRFARARCATPFVPKGEAKRAHFTPFGTKGVDAKHRGDVGYTRPTTGISAPVIADA